ncbi:hypothetical protein BJF78_01035 [Pseudonocardia sp. CNS-139]|nr:hypothetical protein BJF78_01035 [Pseudonocardia sp. CNS-139]
MAPMTTSLRTSPGASAASRSAADPPRDWASTSTGPVPSRSSSAASTRACPVCTGPPSSQWPDAP